MGAVAYLTQSIYGRCTSSTTCTEIGINNNSDFITGIGAAPRTDNNTSKINSYETTLGIGASTTGTIYGIYDMSGGAEEYVMGVLADPNGKPRSGYDSSNNSGFNGIVENINGTVATYSSGRTFPDSKYYNLYTGSSYTGHALTETKNWYSDGGASFVDSRNPWFIRGGSCFSKSNSSEFFFFASYGRANSNGLRLVITNE